MKRKTKNLLKAIGILILMGVLFVGGMFYLVTNFFPAKTLIPPKTEITNTTYTTPTYEYTPRQMLPCIPKYTEVICKERIICYESGCYNHTICENSYLEDCTSDGWNGKIYCGQLDNRDYPCPWAACNIGDNYFYYIGEC